MSKYVFVYGTLKRGEINERLMDNGTTYVADGVIENAGLVSMGYFPGLVLGQCPSSYYAQGEVYEMSHPSVLDTLDHLESEGRLYKRIIVPVKTKNMTILCWAYVLLMNLPPDRLVINGNWTIKDTPCL